MLGPTREQVAAGDAADGTGQTGARGAYQRRLGIVLGLSSVYLIAELVGGSLANSLALLADAGHMLSDVGALALSLFTGWIVTRPATPARSFGYRRAEVLTALVNAATLLVAALFILVEAVQRILAPAVIDGTMVSAVAAGGLAVNLVGLLLLHDGRAESLDLRGAWLHLASDAMGSVGAILSGAAVAWFGWFWADPLASVLIALLVAHSGWALVRDTVGVLMEYAPRGLDPVVVGEAMRRVPGVVDVHDLHVWSISSDMAALSAHVSVRPLHAPGGDADASEDSGRAQSAPDRVLGELQRLLRDRFDLPHVTIQLEASPALAAGSPGCAGCQLAPSTAAA